MGDASEKTEGFGEAVARLFCLPLTFSERERRYLTPAAQGLPVPAAATEKRDADFTGPPDDAHQRAHEVVKDLLNGGISQPTRDQLGKALGTPVAAPMTTASTPKPFPDRARMSLGGDRRRMGPI